jgi:hypothetical protein
MKWRSSPHKGAPTSCIAPPIASDPRSIATNPLLLIDSITSCLASVMEDLSKVSETVAATRIPGGARHPCQVGDKGFHRLGNAPAALNLSRQLKSRRIAFPEQGMVHRLLIFRPAAPIGGATPDSAPDCTSLRDWTAFFVRGLPAGGVHVTKVEDWSNVAVRLEYVGYI